MGNEPIVMENEGTERTEYGVRWTWENGSISYALCSTSRSHIESFLNDPPAGVVGGELMQRTITTTPWSRTPGAGVPVTLDRIDASATYNGLKVVEMGEGIVEGYALAVFTADPELAKAAARAYLAAAVHRGEGHGPKPRPSSSVDEGNSTDVR